MKKTIAGVALLLLVLTVQPLLPHDFWLIPNAFRVAQGDELVVLGQTSSTFPTTLSAITQDRVASARLITSDGEQLIEDVGVAGNSLRLAIRPEQEGQAVVAVAIHPRTVPESPESFRRYLTLEGAPEALERYEREGILPTDSITRRYAKYAKTLVQVGSEGPRAFGKTAGHPLEFVPLSDPSAVAPGEEARFRLMLFGEPLPHARGHASVATSAESEGAHHDVAFESDANGDLTIPLLHAGLWNVRALYILPAPTGSGADWDVHWATLVWANGDS